MKIEIVSIKKDFFELCSFDNQLLHNKDEARPHLIVIRLKYKSKKVDFALPLRSNICKSTPHDEYFPLPPNNKTLKTNHHGIHFIKMFPIAKEYKQKLYNDNNLFFIGTVEPYIKKHFKEIVVHAQNYLNKYERGIKPNFSIDIEKIYNIISK